jgi:hypothetical protein
MRVLHAREVEGLRAELRRLRAPPRGDSQRGAPATAGGEAGDGEALVIVGGGDDGGGGGGGGGAAVEAAAAASAQAAQWQPTLIPTPTPTPNP